MKMENEQYNIHNLKPGDKIIYDTHFGYDIGYFIKVSEKSRLYPNLSAILS
jgi:hypothetical protein